MIVFRTLGSAELAHADGHTAASVLAQPKRLALFTYLVLAAPRGFHRRDTLLALFWPESDAERARSALRQAVRFLRRSLGEDVIVNRGDDEIALGTGVECDVVAFEQHVASGRFGEALDLYRGDLLDGFFIDDSPAWEQWLDAERFRLRRMAAEAATSLAEAAAVRGDSADAVEYARRACGWAPDNEPALRLLLTLLDRAGDRAGALAEYERFAARLAAELEAEPAPETRALIERVRGRSAPRPIEAGAAAGAALGATAATPLHVIEPHARDGAPGTSPPRRPAARRLARIAATALLLIVGLAAAWFARPPSAPPLQTTRFLVTPFENLTGDSALAPLGRMAADWISQGIAGLGDLEVVPTMTLLTSAQQLHVDATLLSRPGQVGPLAREVGAGRVITGSYYLQEGRLLLHARIADAASGGVLRVIEPVTASPDSALQAVETLRARIRAALAPIIDETSHARAGMQPPTYEAYRDYVAGMEAFVRRDLATALSHFESAAAADAAYPMPLIVTAITLMNLGNWAAADSVARRAEPMRAHMGPLEIAIHDMVRAWLRGDDAAAYAAVVRQARLAPGTIAHYQVAEQARRLNRPREAIRVLRELDTDGNGPRGELRGWAVYWRELAWSHHMLGQHRAELKAARRGRAAHPDDPAMLLHEAAALAALGRTDDVERIVQMRLAAAPDVFPSPGWFMRITGLELRAHGDTSAATRMLERSSEWYAARPEAQRAAFRYAYATSLYLISRHEESEAVLRSLIADVPEHVGAHAHLGLIAARRGDHAEALRIMDWLEKIEQPFLHGENTWWRALIAAQLGDRDAAVTLLREAYAQGQHFSPDLHMQIDLEPLRGYRPFEQFIKPSG